MGSNINSKFDYYLIGDKLEAQLEYETNFQ